MKRRLTAVAGVVAFLVVSVAGPASAASPKDAKGCENTKASVLEGYCNSTGG